MLIDEAVVHAYILYVQLHPIVLLVKGKYEQVE